MVTGKTLLNGICPYFTMFPLDFPLNILQQKAKKGDLVVDPFCGRGTTNFAARLVGLRSFGIDSSPVAVAITASKLVRTSINRILDEARWILERREACHVPNGDFWRLAFHPAVLVALCKFRTVFLTDCSTDTRIALRGIILGALHGPRQKTRASYFSNQCPRTYAPKPSYAMRYWRQRRLVPELIDVLGVIESRAHRFYDTTPRVTGVVRLADSRQANAFRAYPHRGNFNWVITSPPYYGMRTYIPDQWLRNWFVGGSETVDYSASNQIVHASPERFASDLHLVWSNLARISAESANMVIRFGGIRDRAASPIDIIKRSLADSGWRITTIKNAGSAAHGKRQANTFLRDRSSPLFEYDVWATRQ